MELTLSGQTSQYSSSPTRARNATECANSVGCAAAPPSANPRQRRAEAEGGLDHGEPASTADWKMISILNARNCNQCTVLQGAVIESQSRLLAPLLLLASLRLSSLCAWLLFVALLCVAPPSRLRSSSLLLSSMNTDSSSSSSLPFSLRSMPPPYPPLCTQCLLLLLLLARPLSACSLLLLLLLLLFVRHRFQTHFSRHFTQWRNCCATAFSP